MIILICRLLIYLKVFKGVEVFYLCIPSKSYATFTLTKYPISGHLEIGNGFDINEPCNNCGILVSQESVIGYAIFDHGYFLCPTKKEDTCFGYALWDKEFDSVSTFATFIEITEKNLTETIKLLKYGRV